MASAAESRTKQSRARPMEEERRTQADSFEVVEGAPRRAPSGMARRGMARERQAVCRACRRAPMAWATAARVAWVALSGLSIMKSCVMPS